MKKSLLRTALVAAAFPVLGMNAQTVVDSLNYTGGIQTYTVPCGVTSLMVECYGAQGGAGAAGGNSAVGGNGGLGGAAMGTLAVTPGQIINVFVGGTGVAPTGGFNGGANGGNANAGGGGGATDIRFPGTALTDRLITAGGGGGGGRAGCETNTVSGGNGGSGGAVDGVAGVDAPTSGGSAGGGAQGTIAAGGAAGIGCGGFLGAPGSVGTAGNGGTGGAGQSCCCFTFPSIPGGGGGGGGFMGGGGGGGGSAGTTGCSGNDKGGGGGGAGGSSDFSGAGVTAGSSATLARAGDGVVRFTYMLPTPGLVTVTGASSACEGDNVNLSCTTDPNATTYTWSVPAGLTIVSGQGTSAVTLTGTAGGPYAVTVVPSNTPCSLNGPTATFNLTINALPTIAYTATPSAIVCAGDMVTFNGTGGVSYTWTGGVTDATAFTATSSLTYTVTGTDLNGCMNTSTLALTVNPLPTVTAAATPSTPVCAGDMVTLNGGGASTYTWTGGAMDGVAFAAMSSVTYTVTGTDGNSCSNTAMVAVTVNPLPDVTTTTSVGNVITANQAGGTYNWLDCNAGSSPLGVTTQAYTAAANGSYSVIVSFGGCSDTSACVLITTTGINGMNGNGNISIYPNPTSDAFVIKAAQEGVYSIVNELGQSVLEVKLNASNKYTVRVDNLQAGAYFLIGRNNDNTIIKQKIVITK